MTNAEQIAVLKARLDDVNNSISQLDSSLAGTKDFDTREELLARITQLQQTADTLRTMLNNLSTTAVPMAMAVEPAAAKRTFATHAKAMAKSALLSADQAQKRAHATLDIIPPSGAKRVPAKGAGGK
jgi:predicted  nucleic acid-binding Zn-ribbon protein